jgi:hypothetical protein
MLVQNAGKKREDFVNQRLPQIIKPTQKRKPIPMKQTHRYRIVIIALAALIVLLSACAVKSASPSAAPSATATTPDNSSLYKAAIERYFNAYIQADVDTLLDALDPNGPLYPAPEAIAQLRATASTNALQGEAVVQDITIDEESADKALVTVTLYMRVDLQSDGNFQEDTGTISCELRFIDGKWRIYNMETTQ